MCGVVRHHLGKGTRWRVPVASPRLMARLLASSHHRALGPYRRSITRQETSLSQHPSTQGRIAAPSDPLAGLGALPAPPAPNHGGPLWPVQRHSGGASMLPRAPHDHRLGAGPRAGDFTPPAPTEVRARSPLTTRPLRWSQLFVLERSVSTGYTSAHVGERCWASHPRRAGASRGIPRSLPIG